MRTKQSQWEGMCQDALPDEAGMVEAARKNQDGAENTQDQCGEPQRPLQEEILRCLPPGMKGIEGHEPRAAAAAMVRQQEDCQVAYGTISQVLKAWKYRNTDVREPSSSATTQAGLENQQDAATSDQVGISQTAELDTVGQPIARLEQQQQQATIHGWSSSSNSSSSMVPEVFPPEQHWHDRLQAHGMLPWALRNSIVQSTYMGSIDNPRLVRALRLRPPARGGTTTSSGKNSTLPSTWNDRNLGAGVSSSSRREGMDDQEQ